MSTRDEAFAAWRLDDTESGEFAEQLAFWERELSGAPMALGLPVDGTRPDGPGSAAGRVELALGSGPIERAADLARACEAKAFDVLLAAWQVLMARYAGQDEVLTGVPAIGGANAADRIDEDANTLVIRTRIEEDGSFLDVVRRTAEAYRRAYEHREVPFDTLMRWLQPDRDLTREPLVQTMVTTGTGMARADSSGVSSPGPGTTFDLVLELPAVTGPDANADANGQDGNAAAERAIPLVLTYDSDLFGRATAERMLRHYRHLLERMTAEPETPTTRHPLLLPEEIEEQLAGWTENTETNPVIDSHSLIHRLRPDHPVFTDPDSVAIITPTETYTHAQVRRRTDQLAHHLIHQHKLEPGSLVAVLMSPGAAIPTAFLGIAKAGAAFVPLSKDWPTARIEIILWDTSASLIVTDEYQPALTHLGIPQVVLGDIPADAPSDIEHIAQPSLEDPVYVMYTSGSTGRPKGALIPHRGLSNRIEWMDAALGTERDRVILQTHQHVFNPSVWQLLWPLSYGGTTVVPDYYDPLDIPRTIEMIERYGVTLINFVPFIFSMFVEHIEKDPSAVERLRTLRTVIVGGDVMRTATARGLKRALPDVQLVNFYGQTETTIACVAYRVEAGVDDPVPVGRPISNVRVVILDSHSNLVPIGHPGEICIAGDSLGIGYVNNQEATDRAFRYVNLGPGWEHTRIYRTGDLGRIRPDGNLECLGRVDHQVKLHGYRIELGEIETVLRECDGVHEAGATIQGNTEQGKRLVSYVVPEDGRRIDVAELRQHLYAKLPDAMVPAVIGVLDRLPLTPSGKIDRKSLPDAASHEAAETRYVAPRNHDEKVIAAIWAEALGLDRVGVHDNYFAIGGQSMLAVKIVFEIRKQFGRQVPIRWMFRYPTVAELSSALSEEGREDPSMGRITRASRRVLESEG